MKFFWIGLGILLLIFAISLTALLALRHNCLRTADLLDNALETTARGQVEDAAMLAEQAEADWRQYDRLLAAILCHDETEQVDDYFTQIHAYADVGETEEFYATCAALESLFRRLSDLDTPFYYNIL